MATEGDKIQTLLDRMIDLEREPSMEFVGRDVDMKLSYDNWLKKKKGIKRGAHGISGEQHTRFSREWKAYRGIGKGLGNVKEQPSDVDRIVTRKRLNINNISDELYDHVLQAFREQHGDGDYDDWDITANKEAELE
jgi:hypothetical protein|tara:strand:- start:41 stop:448 length:408 start_codon:yes stop_codon:yes gene_type:complete